MKFDIKKAYDSAKEGIIATANTVADSTVKLAENVAEGAVSAATAVKEGVADAAGAVADATETVKDGVVDAAYAAKDATSEFHEKYISKVLPDCGKYGDAAKFAAEMVPGVAEYNTLKDGDWTGFAVAAGCDIAALAAGALTLGVGYAPVKGGSVAVKVATKEIAEAGAKKVVKEVAEASVKKVMKETVEVGAEKVVKETAENVAEKVVKETVEAGAEKVARETVEAGAEKAVKETIEVGAEKATREGIESSAEVVSKEAVERIKGGGSYRDVKKFCDSTTHEVHHMPAKSTSFLDELDGPAIKMDKFDHQKTASWGNSIEARKYRKLQQDLVNKSDFRKAIEMDIDDIVSKFGNKYDNAIREMLEYVNKLEVEGMLK